MPRRRRSIASAAAITLALIGALPGVARAEDARVEALKRELFARERIEMAGSGARQGGVPLRGTALYMALDRPDLAQRYRNRRAGKIVTIVLGAVTTSVGVVWGIGSA